MSCSLELKGALYFSPESSNLVSIPILHNYILLSLSYKGHRVKEGVLNGVEKGSGLIPFDNFVLHIQFVTVATKLPCVPGNLDELSGGTQA